MKVLLIDDEGLVREGLALLIQVVHDGAEVIQAEELDRARALMADQEFDFVFLDMEHDGDDTAGLRFLREMKDDGKTVPVIVLSAHDTREEILGAIDAGAYGFIPKRDNKIGVLRTALDVILSGGVYIPPSFRGQGIARPPAKSVLAQPSMATIKQIGAEELKLSPRQHEAAFYVSQGLSNKAIARKMLIAESSVAEYVGNVHRILNVSTRAEFMAFLNRNGYQIQPPVATP